MIQIQNQFQAKIRKREEETDNENLEQVEFMSES